MNEIEKMAKVINKLLKETDPLDFDRNFATALVNAGYGDVKSYQEEIEQLRGQIKRLKEELPKLFRYCTAGDPYFDDYNFEIELQSYQKTDKNEPIVSICLNAEEYETDTKDFIEALLNGIPSEDLKKVFEL